MEKRQNADSHCSGSDQYKHSEERSALAQDRGNRGPIYAKFMDDFWKSADKNLKINKNTSTVGGALEVLQKAYLAAEKSNAKSLSMIGASASIDIESKVEKEIDSEHLQQNPLSHDQKVQDLFLHSRLSSAVNIKFQRNPHDFVLEPVISEVPAGTKFTDPIPVQRDSKDLTASEHVNLYDIAIGCKR